jgi:GntR family transcriptional regulator
MLTVQVDRNEPTPLHDQIAAEIRRAVAGGEARPGGRLLLAKDLAAVLGVNKNTVLRALHILRNERLLECQRGRGITVAGSADRGAVVHRIRDLIEYCRNQGYRRDEVIRIIEELP